jgi:hypothetical protein
MPELVEVKPLDNYRLWVRYADGVEGVVDLSHLAGRAVFALWNDYPKFREVHIGPSGELAWSEEIDLCPDAIYLKVSGKKPEDLFPLLRQPALQSA